MTEPAGGRAALAAQNNADLCSAVFRAHGLVVVQDQYAVRCEGSPPPYFPQMVTLSPDKDGTLSAPLLEAHHKGQMPASIKDSFAELDATALGMRTLFGASWIWREGMESAMPPDWQIMRTADHLSAWHRAWANAGSPTDSIIFPESLLQNPSFVFLALMREGDVKAGCLLNRSGSVVGLSNLFAMEDEASLFAQCVQAAGAFYPSVSLVGYESGDRLMRAKAEGFEEVGPLRVLVR